MHGHFRKKKSFTTVQLYKLSKEILYFKSFINVIGMHFLSC